MFMEPRRNLISFSIRKKRNKKRKLRNLKNYLEFRLSALIRLLITLKKLLANN